MSLGTSYFNMLDSRDHLQISPSDILEVLVQGCDERVYIDPETNRNKYHLNPLEYADLLQRGSCTANVLTPSGAEVAYKFLDRYEQLSYESLLESI